MASRRCVNMVDSWFVCESQESIFDKDGSGSWTQLASRS